MKKSFILILAALLVVAFTLPASAFENIFGGYWRTRVWTQENWSGDEDDESLDKTLFDTRTHLYYTAKFSDAVKLVNQFEFDADWGDGSTGKIGTDGRVFEVKRTYLDMTLGVTRWTIGAQNQTIARGFLFADDFTGLVARYQPGTTDDMIIPFAWIKVSEEDATEGGGPATGPSPPIQGTGGDVNIFGLYPYFPFGDMLFNPYFLYVHTDGGTFNETDYYYLGADLDGKIGDIGFWLTGIYNFGDFQENLAGDTLDVSSYLFGVGANFPAGPLALRAQFFYASGDDNDADGDKEDFTPIGAGGQGSAYYWGQIMGKGIFDDQVSAGSPGDAITNIYVFGLGTDFAITEGSKLAVDLWYANLAEDNQTGESDLGFEIDLVYTMNIIENVNLDLVGAYQFAGDAVSLTTDKNEDDPWHLGSRLSFSF